MKQHKDSILLMTSLEEYTKIAYVLMLDKKNYISTQKYKVAFPDI